MQPTEAQVSVHARLEDRLRAARTDHAEAVAVCDAAAAKVTEVCQAHGTRSLQADMAKADFRRADTRRAQTWAELRTSVSKLRYANDRFHRHPIGVAS
jgi:hypothetical protein